MFSNLLKRLQSRKSGNEHSPGFYKTDHAFWHWIRFILKVRRPIFKLVSFISLLVFFSTTENASKRLQSDPSIWFRIAVNALNIIELIDARRQRLNVNYSRNQPPTMSTNTQVTFPQFLKLYPNDDACLKEVFMRVYGPKTLCTECGENTTWHQENGKKCFRSACCGVALYPLAKTPLKSTKMPLTNWFFVFMLFGNSRNGVAAKEVERHLGVTYKTALRMCRKVRELINEEGEVVLTGTVEMDETLQGGKCQGGGRGWASRNKKCVFGMYERGEGGRVVTQVVPNRKAATLLPIITESTTEDIIAYTDEFRGYSKLHREVAYHDTVNHSIKQWVKGDCHTQSIEGYWGRVKRSITGTYVNVSRKYLPLYLAEFNFRHNHRGENVFFAILDRFGEKPE